MVNSNVNVAKGNCAVEVSAIKCRILLCFGFPDTEMTTGMVSFLKSDLLALHSGIFDR